MTLGTRSLVVVGIASTVALAVALGLVSSSLRQTMQDDIHLGLVHEATLASELLAGRGDLPDPDGEADRIGRLLDARVTLIRGDGVVLGDSDVPASGLGALENHATRPEVIAARESGSGSAVRMSATTRIETEYVAAAVHGSDVAVVRVALARSNVEARLSTIRRQGLAGLGAGLVAAVLVTWLISRPLNRRLDAIASTAREYGEGNFSRPLRDAGRDEIGTLAGLLDRTARELGDRLEQMARDQAHTHAILNGMVEGVVLVDAGGRLVLTNPAVRHMLRLPESPAHTHYLDVVRHPDITTAVSRALAGDTPAPVELSLDADSRRTFTAQVVPVARARGGGAVLVLHDITDLRRADQIRRDFVANVSHELRTPLTAIRGYVEALGDGPPPEQARQFIDIIARHALRMERLVKDLLRLARLDARQEPIARAPCSVAALVAAVEHDLRPQLLLRRQRVAATIAPDAATVSGDAAKLQDVLRNLMENASRYAPEDSVIDVAAATSGTGTDITIADRGPGIPPADITRIFERFYRVDRSRSRDPGGTGLGLSIVRHLVELHDGRVSADNREAGGSIFRVWLP